MLNTTRPDGKVISQSYDLNGNLASLTPPGKPAHTFAYTDVDLRSQYSPPDAGFAPLGVLMQPVWPTN